MEQIKKPAIFAWSGGKDSSLALHRVLNEEMYNVKYLLTTLNAEHKRISMHGVREELLEAQSKAIGVPLLKVWIHEASYEEYERQMEEVLLKAKAEGIETVIFGDIFLEDLRKYREDNMRKIGMNAEFPLWKEDTSALMNEFIINGFETITCCTNDAYLGEEWVGRIIDTEFVSDLPDNVDPCGENGEFHTFCYEGPIFSESIKFEKGEKIFKPLQLEPEDEDCQTTNITPTKGFWFCELIPEN